MCAQQSCFLLPKLSSQLDPRQPLYALALAMRWEWFEQEFGALYSPEGRPALPIRRMVGLLMLKHLHNLSDERVVEFWSLSPYAQFFCGEREMQWGMPCEASELVHFRARIGPGGAEKILAASIALHGEKAKEKEVVVDTTTQEPERSGDRLSGGQPRRGEVQRIKRTSPSPPTRNSRPRSCGAGSSGRGGTESFCGRALRARCQNCCRRSGGVARRAEHCAPARRPAA